MIDESEVRSRFPPSNINSPVNGITADNIDSDAAIYENDSETDVGYGDENDKKLNNLVKKLPQGSDNMGIIVDTLLSYFPERWRNWIVRGIFTILMIGAFKFIVEKGPLYLVFLVLIIQFKCFHELIKIGLVVYRLYDLPFFRTLSWYFLLCSNYFFFGENMIEVFKVIIQKDVSGIFW
uniref:Phosphatidate cytidylyltransferase n=1 Tax=Rhabditophanes sp. KR3021 TaxID=114890 RepID=A0AC35U5K3_9BILA